MLKRNNNTAADLPRNKINKVSRGYTKQEKLLGTIILLILLHDLFFILLHFNYIKF
jgi:hypothetical protein